MKNYTNGLLAAVLVLLSGCAALSSSNPHPGKIERVGLLEEHKCNGNQECSRFSLLAPDMREKVALLDGAVDSSLKGRLIAVLGSDSGMQNGVQRIDVERTHSITDFDYQPFLSRAVSDYVDATYHCVSLWDQYYTWRLDGRQPVLLAMLSHTDGPENGMVELQFDGLNGKLMNAISAPRDIDPCQPR